jgi:formylmethanofuran dehydrogenase subunit B
MDRAWIDGAATPLKAAVAEAAKLLYASRHPLIAGLGTDTAGTRAAIALARRTGAIVDHMHADALLANLDVMREAGTMITTPAEARARADHVLLVGPSIADAFSGLRELLGKPTAPEAGTAVRAVHWLCPDRTAARTLAESIRLDLIGRSSAELPVLLAALRARIARRPIATTSTSTKSIDALAAALTTARFGVALWSTADFDALATEMLYGVIDDLNAKTRFAGLPFGPDDNARGVLQVCGWMTGFPIRTAFGRSRAEHDPWRFNAARLVASGEVDCVLWISAYRAVTPEWANLVPIIALGGRDAALQQSARVAIEVGRPGIDHDAVEHVAAAGTLAAITASSPTRAPSVARVLSDIAAALPHADA